MALELVYTSAEKGLRPGTSGFCTVAMTRGMPPALVPRLEALGGYRPGPSGDGPVAQCFWRIETTQGIAHVLSRVGPASPDHTQRTNKLATYLVLGSDELPPAGPAWLLRQPGVLRESWSGAPAWIEAPVTVPRSPRVGPRQCVAWARACGDAGWAGVAASAFLRDQSKPVHLVLPESLDALELVDEVHALLPDWARWRATFSTYFLQPVAGVPCAIRCCIEGTPAAAAARQSAGLTIDLTRPMGPATDSRHVRMARTGVDEEAEAARATAAKRLRTAAAAAATGVASAPTDEPIELEPETPLPPAPERTRLPDGHAATQAALLLGGGAPGAAHARLHLIRAASIAGVGLIVLIGLIGLAIVVLNRSAAIDEAARQASGSPGMTSDRPAGAEATSTPAAEPAPGPAKEPPEAPASAGTDAPGDGAGAVPKDEPAPAGSTGAAAEPSTAAAEVPPSGGRGSLREPAPPPVSEPPVEVAPAPARAAPDAEAVVPATSFLRRVSAPAASGRAPVAAWTVDPGAAARGTVPAFLPSPRMVAAGLVADGAALRYGSEVVVRASVEGTVLRVEAVSKPASALLSALDIAAAAEPTDAWDRALARCTVALNDPEGAASPRTVVGWPGGRRSTSILKLDPGSSRTWDTPDTLGEPVLVVVSETQDNPPVRLERRRAVIRPGEQDSFAVGDLITVRADAVAVPAVSTAVHVPSADALFALTSDIVRESNQLKDLMGLVAEARAPDAGGSMSSAKKAAIEEVWKALRAADVEVVGVPGPDAPTDAAGIKAMCDAASGHFGPIRDALLMRLGILRGASGPTYQIRLVCPNGAVLLEQRVQVQLKGAKR